MTPTVNTNNDKLALNYARLKLVHGRLLDVEGVDTIIMAITDDLSLSSPLNEMVLNAAGPEFEKELLDHVYRPKLADSYSFSGYETGIEHIIIVVKPAPKSAVILEDKYLIRSYKSALAKARDIGSKKIAFPAMGSEYLKYPPDRAARLGISAVTENMYDELEEIRIVCKEQRLYKAFLMRLRKNGWLPDQKG